jgi:hypothetical protein
MTDDEIREALRLDFEQTADWRRSPFQLAVPRKMRACWPLAPQGVNTAPEKRVAFYNTAIIATSQGRWAAVVTSGGDPCSIRGQLPGAARTAQLSAEDCARCQATHKSCL